MSGEGQVLTGQEGSLVGQKKLEVRNKNNLRMNMIYLRHSLISCIPSQHVTCSYTYHQETLQVDTHRHKTLKGDTHRQYTLQVVTDHQEELHTVKKTLQIVSHYQRHYK